MDADALQLDQIEMLIDAVDAARPAPRQRCDAPMASFPPPLVIADVQPLETHGTGFFPNVETDALYRPLDVCFATIPLGSDPPVYAPGEIFIHHVKADRAAARQVKRPPPGAQCVRDRLMVVHSGRYMSINHYGLISRDCSKYFRVSNNGTVIADDPISVTPLSIQFTLELSWTVTIGTCGKLGLRFFTDPTGARESFRLRDIPNGKSRRAAILHWVRAHSRRIHRDDPSAMADVMKHLRGQREFVWNDLRVAIHPSVSDAHALDAARKARR